MRLALSIVFLAMTAPLSACAQQPPFSQRAAVTQMMGFTTITLTYGRPVARGRRLFGGVVKYGRAWTPGADSASTIEFDKPVMFAGQRLAAGRYSIWVIPDTAQWIFTLSDRDHVFHTDYPGPSHEVLRVPLQVHTGPHVESLLYYFPESDRDHVVLRVAWGETFVEVPIRVAE